MTIVIEIDRRFQLKPGKWSDGTYTRIWWGFLAVGIIREPWDKWVTRPKVWRQDYNGELPLTIILGNSKGTRPARNHPKTTPKDYSRYAVNLYA